MTQLVDGADGTSAPPTAAPETGRARTGLWATVAVVLAAALGVAILLATTFLGLSVFAPAAAAALLAVPLVLVRPVAFLMFATVFEVANLSGVAALNGLPGGETLVLGLAVVAVFIAWAQGLIEPARSPLMWIAFAYVIVMLVAALAGEDVSLGLISVAETAKALLWPVVIGALLLVPGRSPEAMATAFAFTLAGLAGLTLLQEFVLGNGSNLLGLSNVPLDADIGGATARHAGPWEDPNFWGRVLVLGLPLALSLAAMATARLRRVFWVGVTLAICAGAVLTGSRGTLLAVVAVVAVWALLTGGVARRALLLAPLVLGALLLVPGVGSRLLTISELGGGATGLALSDPSLEGRVAAQEVALHVVLDHPLLGVGPDNFTLVSPDYLSRLALHTLPLAPHNLYLELAAEAGLLGLMAWFLLLGATVVAAVRARMLARVGGPEVERDAPIPLANAVLAALVGWSVASVFLHMATFRTFLFIVALAAALDIRARSRFAEVRRAGRLPVTAVRVTRRRPRRGVVARWAVTTLLVLLLAGSAVLWTLGDRTDVRTWSAATSMQLITRDEDSDSPAYDLDTLSRTAIVRTLGSIATSPRFVDEGMQNVDPGGRRTRGVTVEVTGSVQSGLIVVTARGPDAEVAEEVAGAVRTTAMEYLNSLSPLYGVDPVTRSAVVTETRPPLDRRLALLPLAGAAAIAVGWVVTESVRRSRHRRAVG